MLYNFLIILICIAAVLLVLVVLAQNPKSGMAANFASSNQVMGVRQTADFLEKFTWGLAITIVVLSLAATMAVSGSNASSDQLPVVQQTEMENQGINPEGLPLTATPAGEDSTGN